MTLVAERLTCGYRREKPVLRDVTIEMAPGRVTAIIGPNGAGKSTLLRTLLGAMRPWRGAVTLNGKSVSQMPARLRAASIAYVPQRPQLEARFTTRQVVALGRYALSQREEAVDKALDALRLSDRGDDLFSTLSVGQQQRATLARALAQLDRSDGRPDEKHPTRVLLADEPMSAMDPAHALLTMQALRSLADEGVAVCVALHDLTAAIRLADRAAVMSDQGAIAACGKACETLTPDILRQVFHIGFHMIESPSGPVVAPVAQEAPSRADQSA